jgi:hypothetical protein
LSLDIVMPTTTKARIKIKPISLEYFFITMTSIT